MDNRFDSMTARFTRACLRASDWKHHYFGAAYATRIRTAIAELKEEIKIAEEDPEIRKVD